MFALTCLEIYLISPAVGLLILSRLLFSYNNLLHVGAPLLSRGASLPTSRPKRILPYFLSNFLPYFLPNILPYFLSNILPYFLPNFLPNFLTNFLTLPGGESLSIGSRFRDEAREEGSTSTRSKTSARG